MTALHSTDHLPESECGFCGSHGGEVVIRENGYLGIDCPSCGVIYTSPRPDPSEVVDLYDHGRAHISPDGHITKSRAKRLDARHHLKLIREFIPRGDLLEVGAGAGYFLDEARRAGFSPFAIELSSAQAEFIRDHHRIACEQAPLSQTSFGEQVFDLIYHVDVLSHFHDPVAVFRTQWNKLRPGGYLFFETGNFPEVSKSYYGHISTFQYPDHLYFFGEAQIRRLLKQTGFIHHRTYRYSISPQLRFVQMTKALEKLKAASRGTQAAVTGPSAAAATTSAPPVNGAAPRRREDDGLNWRGRLTVRLNHLIRYEVGRWAPKQGRPQTLIVVAQKPTA